MSSLEGHPAKPMTRNTGNRKKLSSWDRGVCSKIAATLAQFVLATRGAQGRGKTFMASRGQLAKRALVKVLLALAAVYGLVVSVSRDSADDAVKAAYRRVVKRAHPDKGGALADAQRLQAAKEAWDAALGAKRARAPPQGEPGGSAPRAGGRRPL